MYGNTTWTHGGKFSTWHGAKTARNERFAEMLLRWEEEHDRLVNLVKTLQAQAAISADMASKYRAMQTRLRKFEEKTLLELLWEFHSLQLGPAKSALRRYEIDQQAEQEFTSLSGGQQARFQILLLELAGDTSLLLDEPTDNLDLASAESLEQAIQRYEGTVISVTHDRWFARGFTRFLVFGAAGQVFESPTAIFDQ